MKKITVIGGGTGTFVVLSGLKQYPMDIAAIVSTIDSGGSTGRLRDQYGVLPPGDLRQCLVALSEAPDLWRKLFLHRFENGDFNGHNFGNIFLTALDQLTPDYNKVIEMASYILKTKGTVIPVTFDDVHLCAEYQDGEIIETEDLIDTALHKKIPIKRAYLKPRASANPKALSRIRESEYIILGPGDMYTSIIPNILVRGMRPAIRESKATLIYIVNLVTKNGQTPQYSAFDHVKDIEKYIGRPIDIVIMNNRTIPDPFVNYYEKYGEKVIQDDLDERNGKEYTRKIIRTDVLSTMKVEQKKSDTVMRSILRHDSIKLASTINKLLGRV